MRSVYWVTLVTLVSSAAFGQTPPPRLEFEVASVKAAEPLNPMTPQVNIGLHIDGAQVRLNYLSLRELVATANRVRSYQVDGPEFLTSERFDIAAKLPEGSTRDQVPEMLQSLLADRFQVATHRGTKEFPVLALTVAKSGLRMKASTPDPELDAAANKTDVNATGSAMGTVVTFSKGSSYSFGDNRFEAKRLSMANFANSLARYEADPVVDMTGLTGMYDFVVQLTPEDYRAMLIRVAVGAGVQLPPEALRLMDTSTGDSLTAGLDALGLKLEKRKAPIDTIIVDKASKTPTAN
jgi:uncharacterized protein (TIGR03435 family)